MTPILLIDGDQFLFKASVAVERETRWDDQNHVLYSNENEAHANLTGMLDRIFQRFNTREHALCFSQAPNFRISIDPTYKAGRSPRKPLCYALLRELVEKDYNCVAMPGLEADDVMGILATKPGKRQRIIVSQDKDMRTIPGTLWDGEDVIKITEAEADYFHLYQTLIGDTSDGYKGCPGVGPKKAEAILTRTLAGPTDTSYGTWAWNKIVKAYAKSNLTEEHALTQARLARILRWQDWDAEKKEPRLWKPSKS